MYFAFGSKVYKDLRKFRSARTSNLLRLLVRGPVLLSFLLPPLWSSCRFEGLETSLRLWSSIKWQSIDRARCNLPTLPGAGVLEKPSCFVSVFFALLGLLLGVLLGLLLGRPLGLQLGLPPGLGLLP